MTYNSRLFNAPKLRRIVEITDDIAETCGLIADALADYENADGEPDRTDAQEQREGARDEAWRLIGDLLSEADTLRALRNELDQ